MDAQSDATVGTPPETQGGSGATTPSRWHRARLIISVFGFGLLVGAGATAMWVLSLIHARPAWWHVQDSEDPVTMDVATRLENAVVSQLYKQRDATSGTNTDEGTWHSDTWTVSMKAEHANAWLNARLPRWLAGQDEVGRWPEQLTDLQVSFDAPHIHIGVRVNEANRSQVFSATLTPELREDGSLWLSADWVRVGRLPIPASWVLEEAEARADDFLPESILEMPGRNMVFQAFNGEAPMAERPVIYLGEGRAVRLLGLRSRDGDLLITCRTELD